jgi:DNA mismatch repair protein MSH4
VRVVPHSLRMRYEPSEDTMMIDISAIQSLELLQNLRNSQSKDCLFGFLNHALTPMGSRLLRSNILQPSTLTDEVLTPRYDALDEIVMNEAMFVEIRKCKSRRPRHPIDLKLRALALKAFGDMEKLITKVRSSLV